MNYHEKNINLFKVDSDYALAHCVSSDCKMGAGIAYDFRRRFPDMPDYCLDNNPKIGTAVLYKGSNRKIFNLVTKKYYHHKPTYFDLANSLESMREQAVSLGISKIAMPKIGSGLDRLNWFKVQGIIMSTFKGTDIEILVCII